MHKLIKALTLLLLVPMAESHAQDPVFRLQNLNNEWKAYEDLKGDELTVIDFWATWCAPCVRALPLLDELAREFEDRGVQFIGISVDGPRNQSKVKPFVQSKNVSYPILKDLNSELMADLSVSAVPTLLIYNSEGEQLYFHEGFRPGDEDLIREHIEKYLKQ